MAGSGSSSECQRETQVRIRSCIRVVVLGARPEGESVMDMEQSIIRYIYPVLYICILLLQLSETGYYMYSCIYSAAMVIAVCG